MSEAYFFEKLKREIEKKVATLDGVGGVSLLDLETGTSIDVGGDIWFPTASSIKIHLLAALLELHHEGEVDLNARIDVPKTVPGSGVLSYLDDEVVLSWRDVANLMIIVSDNMATNLVIDLIGIDRMCVFLERWGLDETRVARKMQDQVAVAEGRENLATPRDMVKLLAMLWKEEPFSPGIAAECLRILKKPKKSFFGNSLPASVTMANKGGAMDRVRCDAGVIYLPNRPFAMAVMSKYGPVDAQHQAEWVSHTGRAVFDAMSVLDVTSEHGQGIPSGAR